MRRLKLDICASLFILPATFDELVKRDFLKNRSHYGIDIVLHIALKEGLIYQKDEKYYAYKKIAKMKQFLEYTLNY